ncbi:MAG: deacetylase [Armatimonadota bacterium]|nr:deacetylase [Armatimonadota bacterium]
MTVHAGQPAFLVTIDTEGDNLWARPRTVTTRNAAFLPRFQALCEACGLRPTYLTDYEMATSPVFQEFGRDVLARGTAEIGMHLHAWNTPPIEPLTPDDFAHQPYLVEYPPRVMEEKIARLTGLLEDTFRTGVRSHRAGRWALDETYARLLARRGYRVDCSVTPHVSWRGHRGAPGGRGGADYTRFPQDAYVLDLDDISRPGRSTLLELPMTVVRVRSRAPAWLRRAAARVPKAARALERVAPTVRWLRPDGRNRAAMLEIVREAVAGGRPYVQFMLHSSELMPGGSPRFRDATAIDRLYGDLEALFAYARAHCRGATLGEYAAAVTPEPVGVA